MACGDKYVHWLRTPSGKTPADVSSLPGVSFALGEYSEWRKVAERIAGEVKRRVMLLGQTPMDSQLSTRVAEYFGAFEVLPYSTLTAPFTPDTTLVGMAIDNGREGTCLADLLDDELVAAGTQPPPSSGATEPKKPFSFSPALTIAAAALVGYVGFKIAKGLE